MQDKYPLHKGFHLEESTYVEEYCHCIPANQSVAEIYYKNLSGAHNAAFEAILARTNNSMYDAEHIDWNHLRLHECDL